MTLTLLFRTSLSIRQYQFETNLFFTSHSFTFSCSFR